jgi:hypothetical protein
MLNARGRSNTTRDEKLKKKTAESKSKRAAITQKRREPIKIIMPSKQKGKRDLTQKKGRSLKHLTPEQLAKHEKRVAKREKRKETGRLIQHVRKEDAYTSFEEFNTLDPVVQFQMLFGFHPNVVLSFPDGTSINKESARDWLERANTATQCDTVIGSFEPGTICYICGFPIEESAECEHILAVFKAAMYLHLYRNDYKPLFNEHKTKIVDVLRVDGTPISPEDKRRLVYEMNLEYKWAHRCCNQVKKDFDFIKFNGQQFAFDSVIADQILKEIVKKSLGPIGNTDICNDAKLRSLMSKTFKSKQGINDWIKRRKEILQGIRLTDKDLSHEYSTNAVGKIIKYLNGENMSHPQFSVKKNQKLYGLASLATAIAAVDNKLLFDTWRHMRGLPPLVEENPRAIVTKQETILKTISTLTQILSFNWGRQLDTSQIKLLYEGILGDTINVSRDMSKSQSSASIISGGLMKLINQTESETFVTDFFRNMKALLLVNPSDQASALINNEFDASEIAGISYSIFIIITVIFKITTSRIFLENTHNQVMLQFIDQFKTVLRINFSQLSKFFTGDIDHLKLYLSIFHFLLSQIYPSHFNNYMKLLVDQIHIENFTYEPSQNSWNNKQNLEYSVTVYLQENPNDDSITEYTQDRRSIAEGSRLLKLLAKGSMRQGSSK